MQCTTTQYIAFDTAFKDKQENSGHTTSSISGAQSRLCTTVLTKPFFNSTRGLCHVVLLHFCFYCKTHQGTLSLISGILTPAEDAAFLLEFDSEILFWQLPKKTKTFFLLKNKNALGSNLKLRTCHFCGRVHKHHCQTIQ